MSRCRVLLAGLLAPLLFASVCSANMFLNGEYEHGLKTQQRNTHFSVNPATSISNNIFLNHAIISRQASPFTGPTYLPPKEYIKCRNGQQCVRKNQCQNGFFAQQLPNIQNCDEETDICCTYRPPPPPPPPTTTTQKPYAQCGRDSDCVAPADCKNGEIVAIDYIKKQGSSRCYSPDICCRMPSTTLTEDGYIFNLPEKQFPLPTNPTVTEPRPTQPQYRPQPTQPQYRPQPTQPQYRPQSTQPAPVQTTYRPQPEPTQPQYRPQPTQPPYRPQPTQPPYRPQPTQPPYRPQPTTPARPINEYLPPQTTPAPRPTQPPRTQPTQPQYRPQPTQPQYRPQPTQPEYRPQPTQPQYRPQPTTPAKPTNEYLPPQTTAAPRVQTTQPAYRPTQPPRQETTRPTYRPTQPPRPETPRPTYRPTQAPRQPPTYRPVPETTRRPTIEYLPPVSDNEIERPERPQRPQRPPRPVPLRPERPSYEPDRVPQPSNEKPVYRGEEQLSPAIFPQRGEDVAAPRNFAKCASALECTDVTYCNSIGVISQTPINLSPLEAAFRVPLTDCLIPGTGAAGKCCRDPNYVDPWPVNLAGVCAQRNRNTKPAGIKDIDANFAEIPWQAMVLKDSTKSLLCGGAIVGDEFVLTTASCVQGVSVPDVRVKAGEWELGRTEEPLPFQLVSAKTIDIHPEYNPATGSNDMAIIRLQKRLEFATHIQPICISDEDPTPNEQCITSGWGKQALEIHEEGAVMHVTNTSPLSRSDCGADSTGVCSATKYDACEFDSGSALACGTGSNARLKGIYAVENACGEGQAVRFIKPDVKWINTAFADRNKPLLLKRF